MWHDSEASLLAHNLAIPYLGRKPKARVVTEHMLEIQEHVGKPSGNPLLIYRQYGGNTLGIRGK
jgi:hypothetical protein